MFNLSISVKQSDLYRILAALNRIKATVKSEEDLLPYRQAVGFKEKLFSDIMSGNIENFPAYSDDYRAYKDRIISEHGGVEGPYRLHDNLVKSLSVFRAVDGKGWMGGIPSTAGTATRISYYFNDGKSDKQVEIVKYARYLQEPRQGRPARPLLVPKTKEYRTTGFVEETKPTMSKIKQSWR